MTHRPDTGQVEREHLPFEAERPAIIQPYPQGLNAAVQEAVAYFPKHPVEISDESKRAASILPDLANSEALHDLGVAHIEAELDTEATNAFRKENEEPRLPGEYPIVRDAGGTMRLLKHAGWQFDAFRPEEPERANLGRLSTLRSAQNEVFVSRIAGRLGYPIAETSLVEFQDRPWLSYRFISDAMDWRNGYTSERFQNGKEYMPISNQDDLETRPLFNMLVGAKGDARDQGIVDQSTGEYYAIDVTTSLWSQSSSQDDEQNTLKLKNQMASDYQKGQFKLDEVAPPNNEAVDNFMASISGLLLESTDDIFSDYLGSADDKSKLNKILQDRARIMLELFREGAFRSTETKKEPK